MSRFKGESVVVTGAGRGIGKAIATDFVRCGARVLMNDLVEDRVRAAAGEVQALGEVHAIAGDVTNVNDCERIISECRSRFGSVDILANNAGTVRFEPFITHSLQSWEETLRVNVTSMFILSQMAARVMIEQGRGGAIVNMASTNASMGERNLVAYNASKAAVKLLTQTMAIELAEYGIRVNSVSPGSIATDLGARPGEDPSERARRQAAYIEEKVPLGRSGRPEDVASLFTFLASNEAGFMTGSDVVIDGGQLSEE